MYSRGKVGEWRKESESAEPRRVDEEMVPPNPRLPEGYYAASLSVRNHLDGRLIFIPVGPWKVFYFPSTTYRKPIEAFFDPPPGNLPYRGYRFP
ncbi:hypothetical protein TNCV_1181051 [Trichonephila clavipes]|nr:hypothetical protein TNCV_1181051 [Trichonephila clavipes]